MNLPNGPRGRHHQRSGPSPEDAGLVLRRKRKGLRMRENRGTR